MATAPKDKSHGGIVGELAKQKRKKKDKQMKVSMGLILELS